MDRIWQWAWDRYGARYSWAIFAVSCLAILPVWLFSSFIVVAFEESDRYAQAVIITGVTVLVIAGLSALPGDSRIRVVERWVAGHEVDRARALEATYAFARAAIVRTAGVTAAGAALLFAVVGSVAGAGASRLVQYGIVGAAVGAVSSLIFVHSYVEAYLRPARVALAGDTPIGDALPQLAPDFRRMVEGVYARVRVQFRRRRRTVGGCV